MKQTTPLKLWLLTGIILSLFVGVFHFQRVNIRHFLFNKPIEVAFAAAKPKEGDIKVVMICTSFGRDGLSDPLVLEELSKDNQQGLTYSFVKLVKAGGILEDFTENSILVAQINDFNPDYVIIQESFSFFQVVEENRSFGFQKDLHILKHLKALLFGAEEVYLHAMKNKGRLFNPEFDSMLIEQNSATGRMVRPDEMKLSRFIRKLTAQTIILQIPFSSHFEIKIDSLRRSESYTSLFEKEKSRSGFSYFAFAKQMPYKYYYDNTHLNNWGEELYTDWFLNQLHQFHLSNVTKRK